MQNQKRIDTYTVFQSTRPSRGETHGTRIGAFFLSISIHSPLAGRDKDICAPYRPKRKFQSTRPSRGETRDHSRFSLLPKISIHSPLAGRDARGSESDEKYFQFQSTRPSRGETPVIVPFRRSSIFQSTRPSRGETLACQSRCACPGDFNPLAPRGARPFRQTMEAFRNVISIHSPLAGRDPGWIGRK